MDLGSFIQTHFSCIFRLHGSWLACLPETILRKQRLVGWMTDLSFAVVLSVLQLVFIVFTPPLSSLNSSHPQLSLLQVLVIYLCDITIYNRKYTFGLCPCSGSGLWKPLYFLRDKREGWKKYFLLLLVIHNKHLSTTQVYVNEMTFRKVLKDKGLVARNQSHD